MKKQKSITKFLAVLITVFFTFQSLPEINAHSHSTGFSNFHNYSNTSGFSCFFIGIPMHMTYECGKTFHL
ncbi:hypothetical protein [Psychroserpens sp.]|uniref:hypothetical protein n=1 Tax=Psychroserpens sp. TaxID=2020870 RepID=UPI00385F3C86